MRVNGLNVLAIAAAAVAIYLIEFVIYGVLITPEQFQLMSGMSAEQGAAIGMSRMPLGPTMPILAAIGIALVIKWRGGAGVAAGVVTALLLAVLIAFPSRMYAYVYGAHDETYLAIDLGRYLVTYAVAGAILGAWK
jgi:hypothetical protein